MGLGCLIYSQRCKYFTFSPEDKILHWICKHVHSLFETDWHLTGRGASKKGYLLTTYYSRTQDLFVVAGCGLRKTLTASENTSLMPSWLRAEHSMYRSAWMWRARALPWWWLMGVWFCSFSFLWVSESFRRSLFVPTSKIGTPGQWWDTWWVKSKFGNSVTKLVAISHT